MNDKKMNVEDFVNSIMGLDPKDAKKMVLYIERIQPLVSGSWAATTLEDICQIHEPKGEWSKIETKATSILEEIQRIRVKTGMSKKLCLEHDLATPVEWKSHFNRAHGRIGLGKLEAAIEDLTEALVCHQAMMGFVNGLRKPEDEIDILYFRGECLFKLNDLDKAIVDFQAAHAGVRAVGDKWNGKPDRPMEVVKYLLMAMAKVEASKWPVASTILATGTRFDRKGSWIELLLFRELSLSRMWSYSASCQAKAMCPLSKRLVL